MRRPEGAPRYTRIFIALMGLELFYTIGLGYECPTLVWRGKWLESEHHRIRTGELLSGSPYG